MLTKRLLRFSICILYILLVDAVVQEENYERRPCRSGRGLLSASCCVVDV